MKPLECANEIKVIPNGKKRKLYSYPVGVMISFQEEKQETFWWAH
ncbi:hypothetical protein [Tengunoibacter tsumagoiensis]|nr:hypothetical protein [Tengunoibacter tsumagoiensis]